MDTLLTLAVMVLRELQAASERRFSSGRRGKAALCLAIALVAMAGALGCIVAALWLYLEPLVGPPGAAFGSAVALFVLGIIMILSGRGLLRDDTRETSNDRLAPEEIIAEVRRNFGQHKGMAVLAAVVAGFLAGNTRRR